MIVGLIMAVVVGVVIGAVSGFALLTAILCCKRSLTLYALLLLFYSNDYCHIIVTQHLRRDTTSVCYTV